MAEQQPAAPNPVHRFNRRFVATYILMGLAFLTNMVWVSIEFTSPSGGSVTSDTSIYNQIVPIIGVLSLCAVHFALHSPGVGSGPFAVFSLALAFHFLSAATFIGVTMAGISPVENPLFCFQQYNCYRGYVSARFSAVKVLCLVLFLLDAPRRLSSVFHLFPWGCISPYLSLP